MTYAVEHIVGEEEANVTGGSFVKVGDVCIGGGGGLTADLQGSRGLGGV